MPNSQPQLTTQDFIDTVFALVRATRPWDIEEVIFGALLGGWVSGQPKIWASIGSAVTVIVLLATAAILWKLVVQLSIGLATAATLAVTPSWAFGVVNLLQRDVINLPQSVFLLTIFTLFTFNSFFKRRYFQRFPFKQD